MTLIRTKLLKQPKNKHLGARAVFIYTKDVSKLQFYSSHQLNNIPERSLPTEEVGNTEPRHHTTCFKNSHTHTQQKDCRS